MLRIDENLKIRFDSNYNLKCKARGDKNDEILLLGTCTLLQVLSYAFTKLLPVRLIGPLGLNQLSALLVQTFAFFRS